MNIANPAQNLKARVRRHNYQLFLQPQRPSGWLVVLRPSSDGLVEPIQVRATTREQAIAIASSLFTSRRIEELDAALRSANAAVPVWESEQGQEAHLEVLFAAAREQRLRV